MQNKLICSITDVELKNTPFGYTLSLIQGKYKMIILYWLNENNGVMRFNALQRKIGNISYKTLSNTLKELEKDHLVLRKEYVQIPPKVEYIMTARGLSLIPILDMMCTWGKTHKNKV
ncbi:winged helix-turn-helix transcriptional regulator [Acinetobacter populi]|uniref:Transcriptional regulator n=1 Tax=Acinetobacter populi TaxID=1582270 RepID=A0A1Z9YWB0_9GAMM|nr:helix-turn-helix domain-containing protein [Acinetobacter populi]OUY06512.1 transcriptional regulator [Acinetobacter populi]